MLGCNTLILDANNWMNHVQHLKQYPFRLSEFYNLNSQFTMNEFSLKYVVKGSESYHIAKEDYKLNEQSFLIGNNHQKCEVLIKSKHKDVGLCIDLDPVILKKALKDIVLPNGLDETNCHNWFLTEDLFLASSPASLSFSTYLNNIALSIQRRSFDISYNTEEVQLELFKHIINSQFPLIQSYYRLEVVKQSTRKELLKRLILAKTYMEDNCCNNITIQDLSRISLISEYRFFHLFKSVFQQSPYQFLLMKKMIKAKELFKSGKYKWSDIAILLGYDNISSFSKAYKKFHGISASHDEESSQISS
ncbi:MAG TPA: AraC family transcriptional regulator [Saprospiraceae bacterium]|nr:AraC family transcriptional regulator [Saprospiraceae bacterium]